MNSNITNRKPSWLKSKIPSGKNYNFIRNNLKSRGIFTVCEEAHCPNLGECWNKKTATIMILGDTCTRNCPFCNVKNGHPKSFINPDEIENALALIDLMKLKYLVITSVTRDDLPDGGATHFANLINRIKEVYPEIKVEVLIPDFSSNSKSLSIVGESEPFVISHNLETVERLTSLARDPRANYMTSLNVLSFFTLNYPHIATKSSLMVGLNETLDEIKHTLNDLLEANVKIVTFGQYLQPTLQHLPVEKYYSPDEFNQLKNLAQEMGFEFVASGPMVRSSYNASDYLEFVETSK